MDEVIAALGEGRAIAGRVAREVEGSFAAAGEAVGALLEADASIERKAVELAAAASDRAPVERAYALFDRSSSLVVATLARSAEIAARLTSIGALLERCREEGRRFAEAVTGFWMLTLSVRMESARLRDQSRDGMEPLGTLMGRIHEELRSVVEDEFARVDVIREMVEATRARLVDVTGRSEARVASSRAQVEGVLASFEESLGLVSSHVADVATKHAPVRGCFNRLVVALQFQDIVRQRLEHVDAAFEAVLAPREGGDVPGRLALAHHVATVQERQVAEAGACIGEAASSVARSLNELRGATSGSLESTGALERTLARSLTRSRTAGIFRANLAEVGRVIETTSSIATEVSIFIDQIRGHLLGQVATMSRLALDLRHAALNAQIYSERLRDGAELRLLAAETRRNSDDLRAIAGSLLAVVERIVPELQATSAALSELVTESGRDQVLLTAEAVDVQEALDRMGAALTERIQRFEDEFVRLRRTVRESSARIDVGEALTSGATVSVGIAGLEGVCAAVRTLTADWADDEASSGDEAGRIRTAYVMEGQRRTHDEVVRGAPEPARTAARDVATPGGDIELF